MNRALKGVLGAVLGVLGLLLCLYFGPRVYRMLRARPLEPAVWSQDFDARARMVDDVVGWIEKDHPTRQALIDRLGQPDSSATSTKWQGDFSYKLDSGKDVQIDPYTLEVWFSGDRATQARRVQH